MPAHSMNAVPRVIIAPDKFKGSLSAEQAASCLAAGIREHWTHPECVVVPMADGGEGTLDAALANGFDPHGVSVHGLLGDVLRAEIGLRDGQAVVELAAASGLALVPAGRRDALSASSRGTGELISAALDAGARTIVLAIGGSACTDGGAGMLSALGARLLDAQGRQVPDGGIGLQELARVELDGLDSRLAGTRFVLASDVDHTLLGPHGAAAIFGPQKGASDADVATLDRALSHYAQLLQAGLPAQGDEMDYTRRPGAGAAGGVGFAALAVLRAQPRPGVDIVLDLVGLEHTIHGAHLVITGEGSFDEQSLGGKTPMGVARAAAEAGVPTIAACGRTTLSEAQWRAAGFSGCHSLMDIAHDAETSLREAGRLLAIVGRQIAEEWLPRA